MLALIVTWVHVIAAMFWIGGMLFFAIIVIPCLKGDLSSVLRKDLIGRMGRRFRVYGWAAIGVIFLTGMIRFSQSGLSLTESSLALKVKFVLVFVMILLALLHDFVLGPKAISQSQSSTIPNTVLKSVRLTARINLGLGLLIVLAAVFFVRGF